MHSRSVVAKAIVACLLLFTQQAAAKAVFAHYMVGNVTEDHAHQDIDDAALMGLDGFALNIGDPSGQYVRDCLHYMFDYTRDKHPDFKLFVSMDLYVLTSADKNLTDYDDILRDFMGHDAYYKGPNGYPFVSTYQDGGFSKDVWASWKEKWANKIYFVPDFAGALTSDSATTPGWWDNWGGVVDGIFSWESTWPATGDSGIPSIAKDANLTTTAHEEDKTSMVGLSMLQYKNAYDANLYRAGQDTLSWRMHDILTMSPQPDFVQILTWNDGPESHYIGNIWAEQNNNTAQLKYATSTRTPHAGIQPLLTSFITSFKSNAAPDKMAVASANASAIATGALWYKSILSMTTCPYDTKPAGYSTAADVLSWALVVDAAHAGGLAVRAYSGAQRLQTWNLTAGLNFGNFSTLRAGRQCAEVLDEEGNVVMTATGGRWVRADCQDGIYNLNPEIAAFEGAGVGCGGAEAADGSSSSGEDGDRKSWGAPACGVSRLSVVLGVLVSFVCTSGVLGAF